MGACFNPCTHKAEIPRYFFQKESYHRLYKSYNVLYIPYICVSTPYVTWEIKQFKNRNKCVEHMVVSIVWIVRYISRFVLQTTLHDTYQYMYHFMS